MSDWGLEQMVALSRDSLVPSFTCGRLQSTMVQQTITRYMKWVTAFLKKTSPLHMKGLGLPVNYRK